jgi:hypothetical protein
MEMRRIDDFPIAWQADSIAGSSTFSYMQNQLLVISIRAIGAIRGKTQMQIRPFHPSDEDAVISLWRRCDLLRPWNNPSKDI